MYSIQYTVFIKEAAFFKKGVLTTFWPIIKIFYFQSNPNQTWLDCSTHDLTENKKILL